MLLITLFKLSCSISHCCTCDVLPLAWQRISRTIPKRPLLANFEQFSKSFSNSIEGWRNIGNHSRYQHYFVKKKKNTWWVAAIKLNCGVVKSATEMNLSEGGTPVNNFQKRFTWEDWCRIAVWKWQTCTLLPCLSAVCFENKMKKEYIKTGEEALLEVTGSKVCLNEADGRREQKRLVYLSSPLWMEGDSLAAV